MKKYSKKIALILVLSLALALAIPAFAANVTEITGTYVDPTIQVVVTGNVTATVNPLGLPLEIKSDANTPVGEVLKSQIVTDEPILGYTYGTVDLNVGASVLGVIPTGSGFTFASEKPDPDSTSKSGLVYLEVKPGSVDFNLGYKSTADTKTIGAFDGEKVVDALNDWEKSTYRESEKSQLIVKTSTTKQTGMTTIKAADKIAGPKAESCFIARLGSDIVKSPSSDWNTSDGIKVTVTWIFEPAT